jgi:hypothetical protein
MKAKIERIMPKIFEKYAGPDVLALLERADDETIQKFQQAIKNRGEEGAWLFYNGKGDIRPVTIDPRARFEYYVDHLLTSFTLAAKRPCHACSVRQASLRLRQMRLWSFKTCSYSPFKGTLNAKLNENSSI